MADERVNPPAEQLYAKKWAIFGVMMIGWFMSIMDVSVVNITIIELQQELDTDIDAISWVVNVYNLAFAIVLVSAGRLADQFGRKRMFLIGMGIFTFGSALCAAAWSADALIVFRIVQGVGAGVLAPLGFAMTMLVFPPQERGKGIALIAVVALAASASGPVIGGGILELTSWHWIFLINIPIGIAGILLCIRIWPETYDLSSNKQVDLLGMFLLGLAVFCLTYGLVEANERSWDDGLILFLLQGSVFLFLAFFASQRLGKNPMLTSALTSNRQFVGANMTMMLFAAGAFAALLMLSLVFVGLWGWSIFEAALALSPVPVAGMLLWPRVAKGANTRPPRELALPALCTMAAGLFWISFMPSASDSFSDYLVLLPGLILFGIGMGMGFPSINVGAMGAVTGQELGLASGILNTARQLGAALGIALVIAALAVAADDRLGWASDEVRDIADVAEISAPVYGPIIEHAFGDFIGQSERRMDPDPGFERSVYRITGEAAAQSYGWAFRVAALLVLIALPFSRTMLRNPMAAAAAAAAAAAGDGGAERPPPADGGGPAPPAPAPAPRAPAPVAVAAGGNGVEARIAELEASLQGLRAEMAESGNGTPSEGEPQGGNGTDTQQSITSKRRFFGRREKS